MKKSPADAAVDALAVSDVPFSIEEGGFAQSETKDVRFATVRVIIDEDGTLSFSISDGSGSWIFSRDLPRKLCRMIEEEILPTMAACKAKKVEIPDELSSTLGLRPLLDGSRVPQEDDSFDAVEIRLVARQIVWFVTYKRLQKNCAVQGSGSWSCPSCGHPVSNDNRACHHRGCNFQEMLAACGEDSIIEEVKSVVPSKVAFVKDRRCTQEERKRGPRTDDKGRLLSFKKKA